MTTVQLNFLEEPAQGGYREPDTFVTCEECGARLLRSERHDHPHDVTGEGYSVAGSNIKPEYRNNSPSETASIDDEEADEEGQAELVGRLFDVTLSYKVDYRFRIPAWSKHEAKDVAKELKIDATPADSMLVHTDRREVREIYEDDPEIPDDWDPYGSTRLHKVYGTAGEGDA